MKHLNFFFCLAITTLLLGTAPVNDLYAQQLHVEPDVKPYIVGGEQALPGEFPWMVRFLSYDDYGALSCGGSLIHPEWVLTAGHCGGTIYSATVGAHDLRSDSDPNRVVYGIDRVIRQPLYDD